MRAQPHGYIQGMEREPEEEHVEDPRLEELKDKIEEVRKDENVAEVIHGSFFDPSERFYESGEESEAEDDQTIAPG